MGVDVESVEVEVAFSFCWLEGDREARLAVVLITGTWVVTSSARVVVDFVVDNVVNKSNRTTIPRILVWTGNHAEKRAGQSRELVKQFGSQRRKCKKIMI